MVKLMMSHMANGQIAAIILYYDNLRPNLLPSRPSIHAYALTRKIMGHAVQYREWAE